MIRKTIDAKIDIKSCYSMLDGPAIYIGCFIEFHSMNLLSSSWQWHRAGSRWSPARTLPVAPLWCDLGFFPNSRGNKAAANLRPTGPSS